MNKDNKGLIKILKSLKTDPELGPTAEFRAGLKKRLMAEIPVPGWFAAWPEFSWGGWGRRPAWVIAGVVLMVAGTTTVLAQKSLPTQKLYPVKIAGERAAMAAAKDEWKPQITAGREEKQALAAAVDNYRQHLVQAEHFRDRGDEEWAAGIDRHWETLKQLEEGRAEVENQYARSVRKEGNEPARKLIREVFRIVPRKHAVEQLIGSYCQGIF